MVEVVASFRVSLHPAAGKQNSRAQRCSQGAVTFIFWPTVAHPEHSDFTLTVCTRTQSVSLFFSLHSHKHVHSQRSCNTLLFLPHSLQTLRGWSKTAEKGVHTGDNAEDPTLVFPPDVAWSYSLQTVLGLLDFVPSVLQLLISLPTAVTRWPWLSIIFSWICYLTCIWCDT